MAAIARRKFLVTSSTAVAVASLATLGRKREALARGPWGDLIPDPDGILDLPDGFSYAILETAGEDMDDGFQVPGRPDGMACFAGPDDTLILMRNHENSYNDFGSSPYQDGQDIPPESYHANATGGVTRLVLDANSFERISSNLVLVGTIRNCAGGPSPWGWLSCEENTDIIQGTRHGYVFLCPTDAASVQPPQRIDGYGRYNHEAVCVDPSNHYAYLTEDRGDSCLYRFVPDDMNDPFTGTLQALRIVGMDNYDTDNMDPDDLFEVEWVDVPNPDPNSDNVRDQAQDLGAATIVRGEGIWFFEGQVYICSTSGGPAGEGQIFRLIDGDNPSFELIVQSTDSAVLDNPDNITVAPWGEVFMAEDGGGDQYIRWINDQGEICDFARNALSGSEFAGVCFSPAGDALFVNIQGDGLTLVVTGPFPMSGGDGDGDGDPTGDGDGDPSTGDGDGDPSTGDGDGDPTTTGGNEGTDGGMEQGETGDMGETGGTGGDAGVIDGEGCGCSTDDGGRPGVAAALTVAAAIGIERVLSHGGEDDEIA